MYSCGHPEFGVLGHGSDGKFIISTGREGFREVSSPKLIDQWHLPDVKGKDFLGATVEPPCIKRVCCGNKHTLAVDADGSMWSWGFNGYGRLGLNDPHDRKRPCKVPSFASALPLLVPPNGTRFTAGRVLPGAARYHQPQPLHSRRRDVGCRLRTGPALHVGPDQESRRISGPLVRSAPSDCFQGVEYTVAVRRCGRGSARICRVGASAR
jgi:hypothetical protein